MPKNTLVTLPGGFQIPVPSWASTGFGIIAVVAVSFGVYRYFYPPELELVTVKQANAALQLELTHYNQHIVDLPVSSLADAPSRVALRIFADGCLLISRAIGDLSYTRLLVDQRMAAPRVSQMRPPAWWTNMFSLPITAASRCLNPHPGEFQTVYGRKDGCWVEVIRTFPDRCAHVQMFNACSGTWATNPDGSPKIVWVNCVH